MSSGIFKISVSTVPAFFRRSSSFSLSSAQLVLASKSALVANTNILFLMAVSWNGSSCGSARAASHTDGSTLSSRRYRHARISSSCCQMAALALNFSASALSELYIENRKPGEFFLYVFVGITCGNAAPMPRQNCNQSPNFQRPLCPAVKSGRCSCTFIKRLVLLGAPQNEPFCTVLPKEMSDPIGVSRRRLPTKPDVVPS